MYMFKPTLDPLLTTLGMLWQNSSWLVKNSGRNSVLQKRAQNNFQDQDIPYTKIPGYCTMTVYVFSRNTIFNAIGVINR